MATYTIISFMKSYLRNLHSNTGSSLSDYKVTVNQRLLDFIYRFFQIFQFFFCFSFILPDWYFSWAVFSSSFVSRYLQSIIQNGTNGSIMKKKCLLGLWKDMVLSGKKRHTWGTFVGLWLQEKGAIRGSKSSGKGKCSPESVKWKLDWADGGIQSRH